MQERELNIFCVGEQFSGAGTVAKLIYGNWQGFKIIDMNYMIDGLYNDFMTINQHKGQMRLAVRTSVILKNAEYLYRSIGIPEFISAEKMWQWTKYIDEPCSPIKFKRAIWRTMKELNPTWRRIFVRERMIERPSTRYVFSHALNEQELGFAKNPIIVWVEATDISKYQHGFQSKQGITYDDILTKEYAKFESYCRKKADFIIYNNDDIKTLELQVDDLRKSIGVEDNSGKIKFYREKFGLQ